MSDIILETVKDVIGIPHDTVDFDPQLILHINSMLNTVNQVGVGKDGFSITGTETWDEFLGEESINTQWVKSYIALRVWLIFDINSLTSGTVSAIKEEIHELEVRFFLDKEVETYDRIGV